MTCQCLSEGSISRNTKLGKAVKQNGCCHYKLRHQVVSTNRHGSDTIWYAPGASTHHWPIVTTKNTDPRHISSEGRGSGRVKLGGGGRLSGNPSGEYGLYTLASAGQRGWLRREPRGGGVVTARLAKPSSATTRIPLVQPGPGQWAETASWGLAKGPSQATKRRPCAIQEPDWGLATQPNIPITSS